jgi:hypothetical protein
MKIIQDGGILSAIASIYLFAILCINPRLFLQDYPEGIRDAVPPKTIDEQRLSLMLGYRFYSYWYLVRWFQHGV